MIRVIFMGTPYYAKEILQELLNDDSIEVVSVYTQPDKPVGRKKLLTPPPVKLLAQQHGIEVVQPERLRDADAVARIRETECDFIVVAAYGQILPKEVLEHATCINLHASILPKYRGASPIQQALLNGDTKTGVTAMLMDEGLDTGDIITIRECEILPDDTAVELFEKLTRIAASMTPEVLRNFRDYTLQKQDDSQASYCKKIKKEDGLVAFENAEDIYNRYRAFVSWPGVFLQSGLKLKKIALEESTSSNAPGEILAIKKEYVRVGCAKGSLRIYKVQPPSKKEMDIAAYINGKRLQVADTLA